MNADALIVALILADARAWTADGLDALVAVMKDEQLTPQHRKALRSARRRFGRAIIRAATTTRAR